MKNVSTIWLIAIFILLPNIFFNQLIEPENSLKTLVFSSVSIIGLLICFFQKKQIADFEISVLFLIALAFIAIKSIGIFISYNKSEAIFDVLHWGLIWIISIFIFNDFSKKNLSEKLIAQLSVFTTFLFLFWGIYSVLPQIELYFQNKQPFHIDYHFCSTLGNKNFYAQTCFLLLPLLVINFSKQNIFWKVFVLVAIAINAATIILLRSFSVYAAIVIAILLLLFYFIQHKKIAVLICIFAFAMAAILVIAKKTDTNFLQKKLHEFSTLKAENIYTNSTSERAMLWQTTWKMAKENPFGIGTCNWAIYYLKYALDCSAINNFGEMKYKRPHNEFLLALAENGWIGFLVLLLFFLIATYQCVLIAKKNSDAFALLAMVLGFATICLFDFPTQRFYGLQLFFIGIALISFFTKDEKSIFSKTISISTKTFYMVAILITASTFSISAMRSQGEFLMYDIVQSRLEADWWRMNEDAKDASAVYYTHDPVGQPTNWYRGSALMNDNKLHEAKYFFYQSLQQNPFHFETWNDLGSCYERLGNNDSALICFQRNLKFAPHHPNSTYNAALIFFERKQYDSAKYYFDKTLFKNVLFSKMIADSLISTSNSAK